MSSVYAIIVNPFAVSFAMLGMNSFGGVASLYMVVVSSSDLFPALSIAVTFISYFPSAFIVISFSSPFSVSLFMITLFVWVFVTVYSYPNIPLFSSSAVIFSFTSVMYHF